MDKGEEGWDTCLYSVFGMGQDGREARKGLIWRQRIWGGGGGGERGVSVSS